MKNSILTFLLISFTLLSTSAQTTLILDNNSSDPMHYKTFAEAIEAATAGSTILVQGSGVSYGDITIDKAVNIYGPGFYIGENPGTEHMSTATAKFGEVIISNGIEGTVLSGLDIRGICTIKGDKTFVQRNRIRAVRLENANDVNILQNDIHGKIDNCSFGSIYVKENCNNICIFNNYLFGEYTDCNNAHAQSVESTSSSSLKIKNNILQYGGTFHNSNLESNIVISGTIPSTSLNNNNTYFNNIFLNENSELNEKNNNITNAGTLMDLFDTTGEKTIVQRFTLKENSVAKGAGEDGTDAGIFGGAEPFVPSGIPGIPTVYSIEIQTNVNDDNLKVKVKARTNN